MKYKLLLIYMLFSLVAKCQHSKRGLSAHGSLIVASKCSDGIVLAADSRMYNAVTENDTIKDPAFIIDGVQKIYAANKYLIGFTGESFDNNLSHKKILDSFLLSTPKYTTPLDFIIKFHQFFVLNNFNLSMLVTIVCCGYYNDQPMIAYSVLDKVGISKGGFFISTNVFSSIHCDTTITMKKQREFLKKFISNFPKMEYEKNIIGGPISTIQVDKSNNLKWVPDINNFKSWDYKKDFIKEVLNKKIKLSIINKSAASELLEIFKDILDEKTPI